MRPYYPHLAKSRIAKRKLRSMFPYLQRNVWLMSGNTDSLGGSNGQESGLRLFRTEAGLSFRSILFPNPVIELCRTVSQHNPTTGVAAGFAADHPFTTNKELLIMFTRYSRMQFRIRRFVGTKDTHRDFPPYS